MPDTPTVFDQSHGELLIQTGVSGAAAKLGHRLTLVLNSWRATVSWSDDRPVGVDFTADVDSLEVVRGDGGVKGLSSPEKMVVRSNALKSFDVRRYPRIMFGANTVEPTADGYRLVGDLEIHGQAREWAIDLVVTDLDDAWTVSCETAIRQTEFGIKPYSLMLGALSVADGVTVSVTARRAKDG
ncbi:MAG: YceI family protein [Mycobacterium sp.]